MCIRDSYISDPRSKCQEDRTKIVVAIVDETFLRTHTHRQTLKWFYYVQCHELHWTDNYTMLWQWNIIFLNLIDFQTLRIFLGCSQRETIELFYYNLLNVIAGLWRHPPHHVKFKLHNSMKVRLRDRTVHLMQSRLKQARKLTKQTCLLVLDIWTEEFTVFLVAHMLSDVSSCITLLYCAESVPSIMNYN